MLGVVCFVSGEAIGDPPDQQRLGAFKSPQSTVGWAVICPVATHGISSAEN